MVKRSSFYRLNKLNRFGFPLVNYITREQKRGWNSERGFPGFVCDASNRNCAGLPAVTSIVRFMKVASLAFASILKDNFPSYFISSSSSNINISITSWETSTRRLCRAAFSAVHIVALFKSGLLSAYVTSDVDYWAANMYCGGHRPCQCQRTSTCQVRGGWIPNQGPLANKSTHQLLCETEFVAYEFVKQGREQHELGYTFDSQIPTIFSTSYSSSISLPLSVLLVCSMAAAIFLCGQSCVANY